MIRVNQPPCRQNDQSNQLQTKTTPPPPSTINTGVRHTNPFFNLKNKKKKKEKDHYQPLVGSFLPVLGLIHKTSPVPLLEPRYSPSPAKNPSKTGKYTKNPLNFFLFLIVQLEIAVSFFNQSCFQDTEFISKAC